jgi:hypothetical protein
MTTCHSDSDLLTVEQFAVKMQVSRTTVFEWLKNGALEEGKHYFKIGRIIRFVWNAALFLRGKGEKRQPRHKTALRPKDKRRNHTPSQPPVNLDY